jgi:glycosyltransferase involved in cell wall biosynthesis
MKAKTIKTKKMNQLDIITSIVIVVQNDEDIIDVELRNINKELQKLHINYEILLVDNNSQDDTVNVIRKIQKKLPFIRVLVLSKEYDADIALTAGIDNCIGDYAILFNIYTDPTNLLKVFIHNLLNNYDIVVGKADVPLIRYSFFSRMFIKVLEKISTHNFTYQTRYLIGLNRKAINAIIKTRRKSRNFSYINYLIGHKKQTITYTPIKKYLKRLKTENFFSLFFNATDIIISNSYKPLRILTFLGIAASLLFILYVAIITIIYIFADHTIAPKGWISIAFVMGAMFFLLFSVLTLISEYVLRTLHETRNDPLYFIADEIDKSIILTEEDRLNIV